MPNDFDKEFDAIVKERTKAEYRRLREELNTTQAGMAECLGCSERNYSDLENGKGTTNLTKHFSNFASLLFAHLTGGVARHTNKKAMASGLSSEEAKKQAQRYSGDLVRRIVAGENDDD